MRFVWLLLAALPLPAPMMIPASAPRAALISVSAADDAGMATVSGAAGAADPRATVLVANSYTGQLNFASAAPDGSFTARMFAPPGSAILVKHDNPGQYLDGIHAGTSGGIEALPGTLIDVPYAPGTFAAIGMIDFFGRLSVNQTAFAKVATEGAGDSGQWFFTGAFDPAAWKPGQSVDLRGTLNIFCKDIVDATDASKITFLWNVTLEKVFDADGNQRGNYNIYRSTIMTPTGFPIERRILQISLGGQIELSSVTVTAGRIHAEALLRVRIPGGILPGIYRPVIIVNANNFPPSALHHDVFPAMGNTFGQPSLPLVRIGTVKPPKMFWMLAANDFSNGSRGVVALEDRGKFQIASHVITSTDFFLLPPSTYRLEPFAPLLSYSHDNGTLAEATPFPLRFPSGTLSVSVRKPDGTVDDLGSAPFRQSVSRSPVSRNGQLISGSTNHLTDIIRLTTLDPKFDYAFTQNGRYVVTMTGTIEDVWGNAYSGGGAYEMFIGKTLDLETGVIAGTPFTIGDAVTPSLVIQPPVPADVEVRFRLLGNSSPANALERTIRGRANRFGIFYAGPIVVDRAGEYRVDVVAQYTDAAGQFWGGAVSWGSIVETPGTNVVTHGRRGFDAVDHIQDQWLFVRQKRAGGDHLMFPFHHGDVMWMEKDDPAADIPKITIQDNGAIADRIRQRGGCFCERPLLADRFTAGEIPLYSFVAGRNDPENIEQWGYFYAFAERPGVHVREFIAEDQSGTGYWRFHDRYQFQLSTGMNGDLPNDFKFQFGGAVYRDPNVSLFYYGAYASFFVLLPQKDTLGGRAFPPFQGNGGGPSGGPLFTLKGREIDLFFHPTAVRPGTILVQGDTASFAGYSAPTLPSKISIDVTAPSGRVRTIKGQANKVGYFYDSGYDFAVDEPGVWKAKVKIVFDGVTSAGQTTAPFPSGDVLGSREGEFYFYVVRGDAAPLALAPMPAAVRPAEGPITFTISPPAGLANVQLTYTTTMPGFILEEGTSTALLYTYDAPRLARDFPNLDLFDSDGFAGADTITISLLLSGTDAAGKRQHFARQVVIQGEELQMPEQTAAPAQKRRKAAR
ncbi:MAG: hypothetical protein AABO58_16390 [Acidobacteriota bacterium]